MTESNNNSSSEEPEDIFEILQLQTAKIGELLDYNHLIVKICRQQADNWRSLGRSYIECAQMANDIADQCALVARISTDRAGDVISTEWGIEEVGHDHDDSEDDDDTDDDF